MKKPLLEVKNLVVETASKTILNNLSLKINRGETHILLGPNGSGKTSLVYSVIGLPNYKITKGVIIFSGKKINKLTLEKRVKLGMSLVFQNPPVIKGVTLNQLLARLNFAQDKLEKFPFNQNLLSLGKRELNLGFSGGEKKISELAQLVSLNPQLAIFDEIDSGLDITKLKQVIKFLLNNFKNKERSMLFITHRGEILKYLQPTFTHVIINGKIICSSRDWKIIWQTIKKYGYAKCKTCFKSKNIR